MWREKDLVRKCMFMEVEGARQRGRQAKKDLVGSDMKGLGLASVDAQDRHAWRGRLRGNTICWPRFACSSPGILLRMIRPFNGVCVCVCVCVWAGPRLTFNHCMDQPVLPWVHVLSTPRESNDNLPPPRAHGMIRKDRKASQTWTDTDSPEGVNFDEEIILEEYESDDWEEIDENDGQDGRQKYRSTILCHRTYDVEQGLLSVDNVQQLR